MSRKNRRNNFLSETGFSLRRLLLEGCLASRGSPALGQRSTCDIEKGLSNGNGSLNGSNGSTSKQDKKTNGEGSSKHSISISSSKSGANSTKGLQHQNSIQSDDYSLKFPASKTNSMNSPQKSFNSGSSELCCPICYTAPILPNSFFTLFTCKHSACKDCLERYLKNEINESRTDIACPQCSEAMHPSNIETLLKDYNDIINKYEDFMVRRFLLTDPDSRWCPAPDCSFAVIASGCASCPRIRCQRPGCGLLFCYHCKAEWHPDQTCDAARATRQKNSSAHISSATLISPDSAHRTNGDDIKPCPRCQVLIVKMNDGSCNHMVCSICGSEFCWLCMKEISDLHYLSPSGCTFWGKKPWSRKKKLMWQLGTLVGAPLGIALLAGIAVPAMIIGIPVWVGKKLYARYKLSTKHKRNCAVLSGVFASVLVSPILAGLAVAIGVPILLFYVYGVVPVSLCRAGCGVSTTRDGFKFDFDEEEDEEERRKHQQSDGVSVDAVSRIGGTSIGEVSLSVASGSHIIGMSNGVQPLNGLQTFMPSNRESTTALAGSITGHRLEVQADVSLSETCSAVTCISEKSGGTSNDTASTRALAGSILSYRQHADCSNISEDGISERVRITDVNALDQDSQMDKASVGSCRSFRSSERSFDTDSASFKRLQFNTRHSKQSNPNANSSGYRAISLEQNSTGASTLIPENATLERLEEEKLKIKVDSNEKYSPIAETKNSDINSIANNYDEKTQTSKATNSPSVNVKNPSKSSILRNLFFAQKNDNINE